MTPFEKIQGGTLTATASTAQDIQVSSMNPPDFFIMRNITQWGAANAAKDIEFWWERSMGNGVARGIHQTSSATPAMQSFTLASDGISFYNTSQPITFAALTATTTSQAAGAVVSMANTGTIAVNDVVRMTGVTGMQQISGMDFTVTAVSANTSITLGFLDSSGFGAAGTAAQVTKIIPNRFFPRWRWITKITQANPAVVTFSTKHDFQLGERVSFRVPSSFGMSQINNVVAQVINTNATNNTITINLDTTSFTAFAFPTSATAAAGIQIAQCVPAGEVVVPVAGSVVPPVVQQPPGTGLLATFEDRNIFVLHLGATIFANSSTNDVWSWQALKYSQYNGN